MKMPDGYEARKRSCHMAVKQDHCIVVFGGFQDPRRPSENEFLSPDMHTIWMYNLFTEQWKRQKVSNLKMAPPCVGNTCAVVIGRDTFMFGGRMIMIRKQNKTESVTNALWILHKMPQGCFSWRLINSQSKQKSPSPRFSHTGWEFAEKLWVLGGSTKHTDEYLNEHGDFTSDKYIKTNQLLCFDPSSGEWINPECTGDIPEPHSDQPTTKIWDKVWMLGKKHRTCYTLYQLDMVSLIWTKIETMLPMSFEYGPETFSMSAISDNQLVIHGAFSDDKEMATTWIFSLPSLSWKKYMITPPCNLIEDELHYEKFVYWRHQRFGQTCTRGINKTAIVIGGINFYIECINVPQQNIHVMLEPKSLQQFAIKVIDEHRTMLPWKMLPKKLGALLNFL